MKEHFLSGILTIGIFILYYFYLPNLLIHLIAIIIFLLSRLFYKQAKWIFIIQVILALYDHYTAIWLVFYLNHQFLFPLIGLVIMFTNIQDYTFYLVLLFIINGIVLYYESYNETMISKYIEQRDLIKKENITLHQLQNKILLAQEEERNNLISEERNRLSLELHDQSGHLIASSIMQISALKSREANPNKYEMLESIQNNLTSAMGNIRSILHNEIVFNDIESELEKLTQSFKQLKTSLQVNIKNKPNEHIVNHISAIAKEAYNNTIKHTNATQVEIKFIELQDFYIFTYQDNGINKVKKEVGIGLYSMQVRADKMNAALTVMQDYSIHLRIPKGE